MQRVYEVPATVKEGTAGRATIPTRKPLTSPKSRANHVRASARANGVTVLGFSKDSLGSNPHSAVKRIGRDLWISQPDLLYWLVGRT